MATDVEEVVEKVFYRVSPMLSSQQRSIYRFEIQSMIDEALDKLGDDIADSPDFTILQKVFSLPVSSTIFPCTSAMVVRTIPMKGSVVVSAYAQAAQFLPSIQDCTLGGRPTDFCYYTIRGASGSAGGAILLYDSTGAVLSPATISVRANFYPVAVSGALTEITDYLRRDLIDILTEICFGKLRTQPAGQ